MKVFHQQQLTFVQFVVQQTHVEEKYARKWWPKPAVPESHYTDLTDKTKQSALIGRDSYPRRHLGFNIGF